MTRDFGEPAKDKQSVVKTIIKLGRSQGVLKVSIPSQETTSNACTYLPCGYVCLCFTCFNKFQLLLWFILSFNG